MISGRKKSPHCSGLYKERDPTGQFRGGPAWYMARGLGMRWMGVVFALFLLVAYGLIFNSVQANAVSRALHFAFNIPPLISGIALAFCALLIIIRGITNAWRYRLDSQKRIWLAGSRGRRSRIYAHPGYYQRFSAWDVL
ncbi:hypothetical protein AU79_00010 [Salmonella enterica subsp. enterica serovar Enteritidis str. SA19940857]|nr:hypothetical protein AU79_00010 [Salmonella enterica subsp. enterica serovar Enteritidis str. SA19940857]